MKKYIIQITRFILHFSNYKTVLVRISGVVVFMFTSHVLMAQGDYISIGIGPSMVYGDNSGVYREFRFKTQPAVTLAFNRQLNEFVGLRGSIGGQMIESGDYDLIFKRKIINWGNQDQAFRFKGTTYFADFTPVFTTNPNAAGKIASSFQFYAGLGIGAMFVLRDDEILKNGKLLNGELVEGEVVKISESNFIPYIPIRTGFSTNLSGNWDFALEFVLMTTINSELDGNNLKDKALSPDMTGQIQFVVKRYFGQAW